MLLSPSLPLSLVLLGLVGTLSARSPAPHGLPARCLLQRLEEERDLLAQRLRRLEQELEELRTRGRSPQT